MNLLSQLYFNFSTSFFFSENATFEFSLSILKIIFFLVIYIILILINFMRVSYNLINYISLLIRSWRCYYYILNIIYDLKIYRRLLIHFYFAHLLIIWHILVLYKKFNLLVIYLSIIQFHNIRWFLLLKLILICTRN